MKKFDNIWALLVILCGVLLCPGVSNAAELFTVQGVCEAGNQAKINIQWSDNEVQADGFEISRAEAQNGTYTWIGDVDADDYMWDEDYVYIDEAGLAGFRTYYYRVKAYQIVDDIRNYIGSADTSVLVLSAGPTFTYGKRTGKLGAKLNWTKIDEADGYCIYYVKDIDDKGNYVYPELWDTTAYKLLKTIKNKNTLTATFKKLKHGVTYTYIIYAYKNINGKQVLGFPSEYKAVPMDYYAYAGESYESKVKRAFGSEKKKQKNFKNAKSAGKQMKTIKIKVWDYKNGKKGKKITKYKYLTVNKRMAPTIKQIFNEIYKSKEKQVIHDIGCYSYRTGEHMYGLAIDVNPNENYMIDGKKVLAGSYWKPKKDPYSIPNDSDFVKIMRRYGFYRGFWGKRKDYMHFSYFGT